jgi:hypothetical protein
MSERLRFVTQMILFALLLYVMIISLSGHAADAGVQPCPTVGQCW